VKKEMRVLRDWVGPDRDSDALLTAARNAAHERVVVKRPKGAEPLAGLTPSGQITGRSTRFDIYKGLASSSG
jgi:16S rRNA (guanine1516-N2)-methyltransferase